MPTSASRSASQARRKAIDISLAAPQVIAHRLTRMALAGAHPDARDRKEFSGMVQEKQLAFSQAWWAAWQTAMQSPWTLAWSTWQAMLSGGMTASPWSAWQRAGQAMAAPSTQMLNAALTPIHRKAVSNAKRLARTPLITPKRTRS